MLVNRRKLLKAGVGSLALLSGAREADALSRAKSLALLGSAGPWLPTLAKLKQQIIAQESILTPHQNSAMASPPTITDLGVSQPGAFPNNFLYSTANQFRPLGGNTVVFPSQGWQFAVATATTTMTGGNISGTPLNATMWRVAMNVNAASFALMVSASTSLPYRFIVNGQYVSFTPTQTTLTTGQTDWLELDFTSVGGKANRQIIIEGIGNARFRGVSLANGDTVTFPTSLLSAGPNLLKGIYAGDSFTAGTGPTYQADGFVLPLGELLGIENNFASGVGGTGYVATNSGASFNLLNRLFDVNGQGADIIFPAMGLNDTTFTSWNAANIQANAAGCLASFRANNPKAPIFVIGPFDVNAPSPPVTNYAATKAAIQAAMAGIGGCWYIDMQGVAYAQNASNLPHPTAAGSITLANSIYASVKSAIGVS